jgi:hypothetical protein
MHSRRDDVYAVASVGFKCLKEFVFCFFFFFPQYFFQVPRDPHIAVGDDGCAAALVGLKCFNGKKGKKRNRNFYFYFH